MTLTATVTDTVTGEQGTRTASFTVASSMPPLGALVGQPPGTPAQIAAFAAATGVNLSTAAGATESVYFVRNTVDGVHFVFGNGVGLQRDWGPRDLV